MQLVVLIRLWFPSILNAIGFDRFTVVRFLWLLKIWTKIVQINQKLDHSIQYLKGNHNMNTVLETLVFGCFRYSGTWFFNHYCICFFQVPPVHFFGWSPKIRINSISIYLEYFVLQFQLNVRWNDDCVKVWGHDDKQNCWQLLTLQHSKLNWAKDE